MATRVGGKYRIWISDKGNVGVLLHNGTTPVNGDERGRGNRYEYFSPEDAIAMALHLLRAALAALRKRSR
jgi:phosphopantothenate synthetase